ncbi:GMC family oxidoreductase [Caenimonas aquaedulcis]|uniref:GMC family oxidoreductase n=1 Tax=Caenimonas aquaedulcis TaxID=2793270 RepID=A0A931H3N4_9BURK|nr:GMC family oxidoreductase [Caenimonas aquaedulcis]MBG9388000.1 GMC family oxidoreductase [Caenimonas aquaedulcis]
MRTLPRKDAVICGVGWAGSVVLAELAQTGLDIVGLERGKARAPAPGLQAGAIEQDDLQGLRGAMMQDLSVETITHRHEASQTARPLNRFGAYLLGEVVGGAGVAWNGINTRFNPHDFEFRTHLAKAGRLAQIPDDMQVADFGISYKDIEADYDWFEAITGTSGQSGANPFEGFRSHAYRNPPLPDSMSGSLFRTAATKLGYHPYPIPAANSSREFVNPLGVKLHACVFCGFCDRFQCPVGAKGTPVSAILPALARQRNVEIRAQSRVLKVVLDKEGKHARGVEYVDAEGQRVFQPADVVVLSGYTYSNTHLMLLSGIGKPYDPRHGEGVVGRGYAYHVRGGATMFFDEGTWINGFIGSGALGTTIDDFNSAAFTASSTDFYGGGMITAESSGGRPIRRMAVPAGTPRWGAEWKKAAVRYYNHTARLNVCGASMADRRNYLDLDPSSVDRWGRPRLRMTFDFRENDIKLSRFLTERSLEIAREMGAVRADGTAASAPYDTKAYQGSHNTGGVPMGADPATSAVNPYLQSWSVPNVFVVGGSAFPQLPGKNPTATIGALARWSARAIRERYLKNERALAA